MGYAWYGWSVAFKAGIGRQILFLLRVMMSIVIRLSGRSYIRDAALGNKRSDFQAELSVGLRFTSYVVLGIFRYR